ncbi:hypothetical protein MLD38_037415 [Melastoma candidum]|uniref:Uncharacterized protein n=1 Tax=Melastoma candidum TaxID=119954 RepID=A0ACB9LMN3_9MYRT|nr:hypothetical protein MLD38_037415 [Melastoma candidum]
MCWSGRGAGEGNMIIDSGTTLTLLPPDLYEQVVPAVYAAIQLPKAQDPGGALKLCYRSSGVSQAAPNITVHFTGADVKLNWYVIAGGKLSFKQADGTYH